MALLQLSRNGSRLHYQEQKKLYKRAVDFVNNPKDRLCLSLLATGKTNYLIRRFTGYSDGQIAYRGKAGDVSRSDFRNGIVRPYTKMALKMETTVDFQAGLEDHLRRVVPYMFTPGWEKQKQK